ncbi:MAG: protein translocase subunit SecF [Treponema sp.]|nr:protein translocase subunit SecF [Treponema sp.]MCR5124868.1 protein translocase subunit SecF [Treponema sp.]
MANNKVYRFSKFFLPAVILSIVLILSGVISVFTRGINFGLDFKPGMVEEIKVANTVLELSYSGSATINFNVENDGVQLVVSGIGADNKTVNIPFESVKKVSDVAEKLNAENIEGLSVNVKSDSEIDSLFVNSTDSSALGVTPLRVFAADKASNVTADNVRDALKEFNEVSIKELGTSDDRSFQIRMGLSGDASGKTIQNETAAALRKTFGDDKVAVVKSDFMSAQFSSSLISGSIFLVIATLILIFIYATIRFHWDFALASVIAIVHDSLIMITFISLSQMEFSTTTLAAILTIIGYSINATVVILDRVRSDIKVVEADSFIEVLNSALSATLSRSIITTVTTLFSVLALFFFTTGTIHDFSLALTVGLISGCYSSIFIAGAFIAVVRRNYRFEKPAKINLNSTAHIAQFKMEKESD